MCDWVYERIKKQTVNQVSGDNELLGQTIYNSLGSWLLFIMRYGF